MLDEDILEELEDAAGKVGVSEAPMSRFISFGSGGPAAFLIEADSPAEMARILSVVAERGVSWFIMGKGTNLLVADEGYEGLVIALAGDLKECRVQDNFLICGAGATLTRAAKLAAENSLSGLEALAHIPGTLGGAVFMNAGSFGTQIGDLVAQVEVCGPGECRVIDRSALEFGYRSSSIPSDVVVTGVTLELAPQDEEEIRSRTASCRQKRESSQPRGERTFGSVFKNPPGQDSAGSLLDRSGCKDLTVGAATVSAAHANFIVNKGNASTADVISLMNLCRRSVYEKFGVVLEPEVRFLGDIGLEEL